MFPSIDSKNLAGFKKELATILTARFGSCEFLHYGISNEDGQDANLQKQQKDFARQLVQLIKDSVEPNSAVLLDGPSFGFAAQVLADANYQVSWLHHGSRQISENFSYKSLIVDDRQLCNFEITKKFQIILIEDSYHYLDQLELMTKSRELLVEGGLVIIFGEYLDNDSQRKYSTLPNLSSMRQLSKRLNFDLMSEIDFTEDAISTIDNLIQIVDEKDVFLTSVDLFENTINSFDIVKAELANKRRCYKVVCLIKAAHSVEEYANAEYGDINSFNPSEISDLFEKSFSTKFNPNVWDWKYGLGNGKCVVARSEKGGPIVSHYGGAPRKIQYFGESNVAIQVCDVMVLPEVRLFYGRSSLFFKTAATFLEREIGNTVSHLLGFGFPNKKAMNIALRLGLYEKTDDFIELVYSTKPGHVKSSDALEPIDISNERHKSSIDELWCSMKSGLIDGIVGDRDALYVKYRYFDHPYGKSGMFERFFMVDSDGNVGAAVFMKKDGQEFLLMDIICPVSDMQDCLRRLLVIIDEEKLKIWITKAWADKVQIDGAIINELGIEIPCNSWNRGPNSKELLGAWWLTAGDMDFM